MNSNEISIFVVLVVPLAIGLSRMIYNRTGGIGFLVWHLVIGFGAWQIYAMTADSREPWVTRNVLYFVIGLSLCYLFDHVAPSDLKRNS